MPRPIFEAAEMVIIPEYILLVTYTGRPIRLELSGEYPGESVVDGFIENC